MCNILTSGIFFSVLNNFVLPGAGKYKPAGSSCSGEWNRKYRIITSSAGGSGK
jgi:hypothetical protein